MQSVITGKYGGAAFVLMYIFFLLLFALPILVMEFAVGRASQKSVSQSFEVLAPGKKLWSFWGYAGWFACILLMMYYTVVAGWMLAYTCYSAAGTLQGLTPEQVGGVFGNLVADPERTALWLYAAVSIGFIVCCAGLRSGVERVTKIMMAGLLIIMITLAVRSVTLDGASEGLKFYLEPNISNMTAKGFWESVYAALGQSFFTLGLGIGSMAIFGSYISKEKSLTGESLIITVLDTFVALTAGLIIFPACFAYGINPGAGPGLIFVTLPNMFNSMPNGRIWGTMFFLFMSFAALSTVIAVFENVIACFMDKFNMKRVPASIITCVGIFVLSLPCAFGFNIWSSFQPLGDGSNVLDLEDFILSNNLLPVGTTIYLLFCTTRYGWGWDNFVKEVDTGEGLKFPKFLRTYLTYVAPAIMLVILIAGYWEKFF